jgi:hypothetical protein
MRYEEILGSDDYARRLVEAAIALSDGSQPPLWLDGDFVVVPPGGVVQQDMFMR